MLNVYFGDMLDAIYNTNVYFNNTYKDSWITNPLSKEMIKAVDKSDVIDERTISSPVFGNMSPKKLSDGQFKIKIINTNKIVTNMAELVAEAGEFV